jgi:uncharacterized protein YfiM (DUF2279 family)
MHRGKCPLNVLVFIFALIVLQTGCAGFRFCERDEPWLGTDKGKHFAASALIGGGATAIANQSTDTDEAVLIGISAAVAAGVSKEYYDVYHKKTCFSWKDLVWDFIGASVGVSAAAWATD